MISESVVQAPLETLSKKGLHTIFFILGSRFNISYIFTFSLASLVWLVVTNFSDFEEALHKLSLSELTSFCKTYDLKASIVGKITAERLQEKDEVIKRLSCESKNLKHTSTWLRLQV
jgi:hypothetical protein